MSERYYDSVSNRSLLVNALESTAHNEIERNLLAKYKEKVDLINSEQAKLYAIRRQIEEISFANDLGSVERLKSLRFEENKSASRISNYEHLLIDLEQSQPIKDIIEREKNLAYYKAEKEGEEALTSYREKEKIKIEEDIAHWQKQREIAVAARKAKIETEQKTDHEVEEERQKNNLKQERGKATTAITENFWWILLAIITIVAVVAIVYIPDEHWFRRLILAPFILIGTYTIFAGGISIAQEFESYTNKTWQQILIFAISMFGVVAFLIYIT